MVWYSHLLKNFPEFVVVHTVKGFGIVNKAEVDVFLELSHFFDDPTDHFDDLMDVGGSVQFSHSVVSDSLQPHEGVATPCTPGLLVHHQLPESTQTHVHRVSDAIQPSHPLLSPSPPAPNPSQHQSLFQ